MSEKKTSNAMSAVCINCGGQLEANGLQETIECPYCGTKYAASDLLNESDTVRTERIKANVAKEVEMQRLNHEIDKYKAQIDKDKAQIEKDEIKAFKKSKFSKILIICTIISILITVSQLSGGFSLAGVISLVQAGLYLTAWLMGMKVIKEKKKNMRTLIAAIAFLLIIPFFIFFSKANTPSYDKDPVGFTWTDIEMYEMLPEPENPYGEISYNSKTALNLTLADIDEKTFKAYRDEVIAAGYTIDAEESYLSYSAYNSEGYNAQLVFYESSQELTVYLDAPEEMDDFEWPTNGLGSILPATKSTLGDISCNNSEQFIVRVGNTTIDEYDAYVKVCEDKGFTVDFSKDDEYYSAENADGYKLTLTYLGFNKIEVSLEAPEGGVSNDNVSNEDISNEDTKLSEDSSNTDDTVNGMSKEFKEAMDSYEEFFDEYVAIMKKYKDNPSDMSIIADFNKYMGKYAEMMEAFEKWEDEDLNEAESAYYIQVQSRINKKLLEVAQ